jgi:NTE family protein
MASATILTGKAIRGCIGWISCFTVLCVTGCYPVNDPLRKFDQNYGYRFKNLTETDTQVNSDKNFVVLTFSGGGTRAAAFAYGVLEELKATRISEGRTLLDEVDVISSVSGGSFAAAYYGLFGPDAFFTEFPNAVLYRKIERDLILRLLAPWNWPKLLSPLYGRSDLAQEYYDSHIFQHRTFVQLPHKRPFIILNSTDISRGAQMSFTQEDFDRICSDLNSVSVARGVVASSAFPIAFTPITLKNYGQTACGYDQLEEDQANLDVNPQLYDLAKTWRSYESAELRPYIHLSDGGLSDNIGLRAVETRIAVTDFLGVNDKLGRGSSEIERIVFIVVDAKPESAPRADQWAQPPGIVTVLNAAGTNPMENYSSDTVERIRLWFKEWDRAALSFNFRREKCDVLATELCLTSEGRSECEVERRNQCYNVLHASERYRPSHPGLYLIHVRFESIPDEAAKRQLKGIGTKLQLSKEEVNALIFWARQLLRDAPRYRDLLQDLGSPTPN